MLCVAFASSPSTACPLTRGTAIVLVSQELDPNVFLWDSVDRLVKYATGDYTVDMVLKHTTLITAYTRAVTLGCKNADLHPAYANTDERAYIVGVRIANGRSRGRNGWVLSSDVRRPDGRLLTQDSRRH